MTTRITYTLAACVAFGMVTYLSKTDVNFMLGAWVAFAISAMYMPDKDG